MKLSTRVFLDREEGRNFKVIAVVVTATPKSKF
jgi:hypothetical protein